MLAKQQHRRLSKSKHQGPGQDTGDGTHGTFLPSQHRTESVSVACLLDALAVNQASSGQLQESWQTCSCPATGPVFLACGRAMRSPKASGVAVLGPRAHALRHCSLPHAEAELDSCAMF